ncbi:MAG: DUF3846 domain-containing protein [Microbacterium sp.]|uniref:DUF3846 domain-containing protein n=1 Tax=Microbacterium sp. TaxID=51671 RepID=UPI0019A1769E|nr:hypothetical protein [Microbacterium sp.]MBD3756926.1 DUF3846 domain-containing protein [Microbacterium sp.]
MTVHTLVLHPDADAFEVAVLEPDDSGLYLHALYVSLDVRVVDVIRLTDDIDCWHDDEGRVDGAAENPLGTSLLRAFGWHLAHDDAVRGSMLFAGHDRRGGMASLTDRQREVITDALVQAVRM